jgi:hypothetical protein
LQVTGDLRLREQGDYSDADGKDRNSSQLRGRLGTTFALNDRVTLGARLVTGDADDPNSTDVRLSNFDDDLQVSLDLGFEMTDAERKPPTRRWSEQEVQQLRELAGRGTRVAVIALRLGRTYGAVRFTARKLGIKFATIGRLVPAIAAESADLAD